VDPEITTKQIACLRDKEASCLPLQHQKQFGGTQYLQEEELHFLHNDRCSSRPRGGQEPVMEEARLST